MIDRYLRRLGTTRPRRADADALAELHERHLTMIAFENIDYHLGRDIPLGEGAMAKLIDARRGGSCFELNSAFALLLRGLGFRVTVLGGQIMDPPPARPPLSHLALRVHLPDADWLADVGFGRGPRRPMRLGTTLPQEGALSLQENEIGQVSLFSADTPLYRLDPVERSFEDFRAVVWWYRTSPDSPFARWMFCSRLTRHGRITLSDGNRLTTTGNGGRDTKIVEPADLLATYRDRFFVDVDTLPGR